MIDFCYQELKDWYKFKHSTPEELQKKDPSLKIEKIKDIQNGITPHGNDRYEVTHPPNTERLADALNFKPRIQASLRNP